MAKRPDAQLDALDFILDTVPYQHDLERLFPLLRSRDSFASSHIGGIRETQEAVDLCAVHGIRPEVTRFPMSGIDEAWNKVVAKEARYRFVIEMPAA